MTTFDLHVRLDIEPGPYSASDTAAEICDTITHKVQDAYDASDPHFKHNAVRSVVATRVGAAPLKWWHPQITGEGFRTLGIYRLFFRDALRDVKAIQQAYDEEVRDWYETNPGYQFPHCIHGSSLVTDYDNICGGCEDGSTHVEIAQGRARERFLRFNARWDWVNSAPGDLAYDTRTELLGWATSLFPGKG